MDQLLELGKVFVFEKQQTSQSQIVNCIIKTDQKTVELLDIIQKVSNPALTTFKIFDNENSKFVKLNDILEGQNYRISYHYISLQYTLFRYAPKPIKQKSQQNLYQVLQPTQKQQKSKKIELESESSISSSSSIINENKKQRSKQRSIGEVIQLVKRWRNIHFGAGTEQKQKLSLQKAAKMVGVSKKTLDDYYYQLRIGQLKKFDFSENLFQGIGVLRTYIKGYRNDSKQNKLYSKHPRKLQVIQDKNQRSQHFLQIQSQKYSQRDQKQQMQIDQILNFSSNQNDPNLYENNFFGQFQVLIQEPNDPFFNFQKSFQKKKDYFNQDDIFFDQL